MKFYSLALTVFLFSASLAHADGATCPPVAKVLDSVGGDATKTKWKDPKEIPDVPYVNYKIDESHTSLIKQSAHKVESPVVSDDQHYEVYLGSPYSGKLPPAAELYVKDLSHPDSAAVKIKKPLLSKLNIFVKGSFFKTGAADKVGIVACELEYRPGAITKTIISDIKTGDWDSPQGYHSVISFFESDGKGNYKKVKDLDWKTVDPDGKLGLTSKTFLEHPRVSPDNKSVTFYLQGDKKTDGVYVYNLETGKTAYLGNYEDKHPTWSGDGKRIFFHEQGSEPSTKFVSTPDYPYTKEVPSKNEIARIGYYDVNFAADGTASMGKRTIIGDKAPTLGGKYIYQKHPAYHNDLHLVFFHAKETLDGSKSIGVLDLDKPDHPPIFMEMNFDGKKVKHAEHADVSEGPNSDLYFVGRIDGAKEDQLLKLDYAALKDVKEQFNH
jgi:hypothetical protein